MRERTEPANPSSGLIEEKKSWDSIFKYYLKIKSRPVDRYWAYLDADVRSIMVDDRRRVLYGANMYLDKDSGPIVEGLLAEVMRCDHESTCMTPALSTAQRSFVMGNPYYNWYWQKIQSGERNSTQKRELIAKLLSDLKSDAENISFTLNSSVKRSSEKVLSLPLVAGPFAGAEQAFAGYVESMWNSPQLALKIDWVQPTDVPDAFRVILGEAAGTRPYTSYDKRIVQLFPEVSTRSIAHEIGHVLGFPDHYYTTWKDAGCEYVVQFDDADVMSNSHEGSATPAEWAELERHYPLAVSIK